MSDLYEAEAVVLQVHDGDTVHLQISRVVQLPVNPWFDMQAVLSYAWTHDVKVRLARINAPELATPIGLVSKNALVGLLGQGTLRISVTKRDKYDRPLAEIFVKRADGTEFNASDVMVAEGYAKLWNGQGPAPV